MMKTLTVPSVRSNRIRRTDVFVFNIMAYTIITLMSIFCLLPFLMVISASLTDEKTIITHGYSLIPKVFSTQAYTTIFQSFGDVLRAYGVTIFITVMGTAIGLLMTAMTAYVLCRKDFKYRNKFAFFIFFTQMFGGGLIPWYIICVKWFGLKNSIWSLILPSLLTPFYIILMRNFMSSVPGEILESAKIDGLGDFSIFLRIMLPLSTAGLATIGLFLALDRWNAWREAMLFIENAKLYPLQYYLYQIMSQARFASEIAAKTGIPMPDMPNQSLKMAMAVITTGPIIFAYPFVQKYFVKGLTVGAVKG